MQTVSVQERAQYRARVAMQDAKAAWVADAESVAKWNAWRAAEVAYDMVCNRVEDASQAWA